MQKHGSPGEPLDELPTDLPCLDSEDVTSDWVSLLVHNVKKLGSEKHILGQRVAELEAELEHAREEIQQLREKLGAACQLVFKFPLSDF
jgi:hypothetical protein